MEYIYKGSLSHLLGLPCLLRALPLILLNYTISVKPLHKNKPDKNFEMTHTEPFLQQKVFYNYPLKNFLRLKLDLYQCHLSSGIKNTD